MASVQTSAGLECLLGDFDRERFFSEYWDRRGLYLSHHQRDRFAHLISHETFFEREVHHAASLKASARDADGWNREVRIQPAQALKLFQLGMTICATGLDRRGGVGELIDVYRSEITSAVAPHVNCYYSPDGAGYGLHFDTHPVWIVQVAGRKEWTFSVEPAVRNPLFSVIFPPDRDRVELPWITLDRPPADDPTRFRTVDLEPGDVLYLPAGCWHAARARGFSLALTLAVERMSSADLLGVFMRQLPAASYPDTRLEPFRRFDSSDARSRAGLRRQIAADLEHLKVLVDRISADDLLETYEYLAEHPDVIGKRGFADAAGQVQIMRERYPSGRADARQPA